MIYAAYDIFSKVSAIWIVVPWHNGATEIKELMQIFNVNPSLSCLATTVYTTKTIAHLRAAAFKPSSIYCQMELVS